jgi:hypothetical protein
MTGNELVWRVVGYDTKQHRNDSLLYLEETKADAYAKCMKLHPHFDVYFVQRVDDYDGTN